MKKAISILAVILALVCAVNFCFADTTPATAGESAVQTESQTAPVHMTDVDMSSELGKGITKLINGGVVNGYLEPDGTYTFRPDKPVTRAEFCKMVNLTFKYSTMDDNKFTDVTTQDWYYVQVLIAISNKYIQGYTDGTFRGENYITREEVCAVLSRIFNKPSNSKIEIKDTVTDWARPYVENILNLGYMPLEDGGKFRATENMTRGELAMALCDHIVSEKEPDGTTNIPSDTEDKEDDGFTIKPAEQSTNPQDGKEGIAGGNRPNRPSNDNEDEDNSKYTEEELEASERIYGALEFALADIYEKEVELGVLAFDEKGQEVFGFLKEASQEVYDLKPKGVVVSNTYVRNKYKFEIQKIKNILNGMSTEERDAFEFEVNKLNTVVITDLTRIFNVNINYGKK